MTLTICPQHKEEISAALAMRDLNRFNITDAKTREAAHVVSAKGLGSFEVVDPIRTAQALILKYAIKTIPVHAMNPRKDYCPCCVAREDFNREKAEKPDEWKDEMPFDQRLILDAAQHIDENLKSRGLK